MRRLRSRPALQENVDVFKSTDWNRASTKENVCDTPKKQVVTSIGANHLCTNSKQMKASKRKTCKSDKENLILRNGENDVTENKAQELTVSARKRLLESEGRCAQRKDKIDDQLSLCNKDSRKLHALRPRNNLQVADKKIVSISKQPSFNKADDEISIKIRTAKQRSNKVSGDSLKKTERDSKLKEGSGCVKKIVTEKKSVSKLCDSLNNNKIHSYLVKKTALPKANSMKYFPIWNREPSQISKSNLEYDVYDILQDEDMASEKPVKVKKRRVPAKNKIKIKKISKPKVKKDPKSKKTDISSKTNIADMDPDEIPMDVQHCESEVFEKNGETVMSSPCKRVPTNPITVPETIVSNLLKELDESFPKTSTNPIIVPEIIDSNLKEPDESVPKSPTNPLTVPETVVSNLLKELDVSFPKTSTPQKRTPSKNVGLLQRNFGVEISTIGEISSIPDPHSCDSVETIFQTPKGSPKRNLQQKNATEFDKMPKNKFIHDFEINLFESPPKDLKKKNSNKKQKKMVLDLTEPKWKKPLIDDPDIRVMEPRKSYYSPDLVTRHIARTKRTNVSGKQKPAAKKSRQELLIEKMNKEFEDISSLELCVE